MKKKSILLAASLVYFITAAYAQNPMTAANGIMSSAGNFTCNAFCILAFTISSVAAIILILSGARYLTSGEDPIERDEMKRRIVYSIIGLAVFMAGPSAVKYMTGGTMAPFNCPCIPGFDTGGTITTTTVPGLIVVILKPKNNGEYDTAIDIDFMCRAYGGKPPYTYQWTSDIDGPLGNTDVFSKQLSRALHVIKLEVTDSSGKNATAQIRINVIVPKPPVKKKPLQ